MDGKSKVNLVILVLPKLFGVFVKAVKVFEGLKILLVGASFAGYAFFSTWQFSVILIATLFVHEWGHVFAMRRMGLRVRGIYFVPFIGAMVSTDDAQLGTDSWKKAIVYTAGPAIGGILSVVAFIGFWVTQDPRYAIVASWIAAINLFNLLPITPLDGGHILDAVMESSRYVARRWIQAGVLVLTMCLGILGADLFLVFAILYGVENVQSFWKEPEKEGVHYASALERTRMGDLHYTGGHGSRGGTHRALALRSGGGTDLALHKESCVVAKACVGNQTRGGGD